MNKTSDTVLTVIMVALVFIFGFSFGANLGISSGKEQTKKEAINLGFARYNPTNGNIEWINIK